MHNQIANLPSCYPQWSLLQNTISDENKNLAQYSFIKWKCGVSQPIPVGNWDTNITFTSVEISDFQWSQTFLVIEIIIYIYKQCITGGIMYGNLTLQIVPIAKKNKTQIDHSYFCMGSGSERVRDRRVKGVLHSLTKEPLCLIRWKCTQSALFIVVAS